jgi:hypothetical protein
LTGLADHFGRSLHLTDLEQAIKGAVDRAVQDAVGSVIAEHLKGLEETGT